MITKLQTAIIFDIDGTLMPNEERSEHKEQVKNGDYSWFYEKTPHLMPKPWAVSLINNLAREHKIFFITARPEIIKKQTEKWIRARFTLIPCFPLLLHFILLMRPINDTSSDPSLKKNLYEEHIKGKYKVLLAVDDNAEVLRMWRTYNIPTMQIKY